MQRPLILAPYPQFLKHNPNNETHYHSVSNKMCDNSSNRKCSVFQLRNVDSTSNRKYSVFQLGNVEISTLPHITLQMIWQKAEKLLNSESAITSAPGSDAKARMVLSQSSAVPHFVTTHDDGQYLCDNSCPQWVSSKICSHTIAAAEDSGQLCNYLQWYLDTQPCPNVTALGMQGMPSNRGKLSDRERQRKRLTVIQMSLFLVLHWQQLHSHTLLQE